MHEFKTILSQTQPNGYTMVKEKTAFSVIAAPFTPMKASGELELEALFPYANHLIESGISGVFICGTSGEGISLTTEERISVLEGWIKSSMEKLEIICHVGGNSLLDCKDLAVHAERAGADAIAAFSPFFFKPSNPEELVGFMAEIASGAPNLPFYYYHIPSMTGVHIPVADLLPMFKQSIPTFSGVKFTHTDHVDMQKCIAFNNGEYRIFNGFDEALLCGLSLGVQAAVGSTYNYMANVYMDLIKSFNEGDLKAAQILQQYSVSLVNILIKHGGGVRAGKAVMKLLGIDCGPCRLPISAITMVELDQLKKQLEEIRFFSVVNKKTSPLVLST